ncbi:uncharacterized protein A4U43_C01F18010 [Asparagus officinalis]|uniref:AAA ATPase AAA+ lid domain-containing protein n=1 Tax=Asparagus officinalis TaxID=4686 RepID=A0A5P1FQ87_ASPOF|nr:uncharacterized protein A4U43_C01F18010 [Asparagus officinalis]
MLLLYFALLIPIAVVNLGLATFFLDFKMFYNSRFGRKKEENEETTESRPDGNSNGAAHANGGTKNTPELAVFEQFERQERPGVISNGNLGTPQRPLLPEFDSAETRTLAETLCRDIIRGSPDVKWESIKGLDNAKKLLKEAVVMPIKYPKYFTGLLSPWKGILLFGPPGTGKMDGLMKTNELVFVLAATNLPWELDAAMLRRLEKRILVPLPEPEARQAMFEELLPCVPGEEEIRYDFLVENTEGYSGSDIRLVCKEAAMQPLRRLMSVLERQEEVVPDEELPAVGPVTPKDIEAALKNTRPSAHLHAHRYEKFNDDYGSQILH